MRTVTSACLILTLASSLTLLPSAASSFSFCRASLEHTLSAEELSYQLPRRAGGSNLTWHDGRGQKTAHTRTVKLLQQPGTEGIQVRGTSSAREPKSGAEECFGGGSGLKPPAFLVGSHHSES